MDKEWAILNLHLPLITVDIKISKFFPFFAKRHHFLNLVEFLLNLPDEYVVSSRQSRNDMN